MSFERPDQGQIALGVEVADVAGVQPAVDDDSGGVLRTAEIAAHDVGAAHDDLTVHARRHLGAVVVDDADLLAGEGKPHGSGASRAGDGVDGGAAGPFGQPVALDEGKPVPGLEPGQQLGGGGCGAADCRTAATRCRAERRPEAPPACCRSSAPR